MSLRITHTGYIHFLGPEVLQTEWLKQQKCFVLQILRLKPEIKVSAGLVPSEESVPAFPLAPGGLPAVFGIR